MNMILDLIGCSIDYISNFLPSLPKCKECQNSVYYIAIYRPMKTEGGKVWKRAKTGSGDSSEIRIVKDAFGWTIVD